MNFKIFCYPIKMLHTIGECYTGFISLYKKNSLIKKAYNFFNHGKYQEALKCYDEILESDSEYTDAWFGKGVVLGECGKYHEALEDYDKVLELDPEYTDAWHGKGVALEECGRHHEALKAYDKILKTNSNHAKAWHGKGVALRKCGKCQEALEAYDKALELDQGILMFGIIRLYF